MQHTLCRHVGCVPDGQTPLMRARAQAADGDDARFLRGYSLYLAGEKRKREEQSEAGEAQVRLPPSLPPFSQAATSQSRASAVENRELGALEAELAPLFEANALCPFACYLLGLVLSARGRTEAARAALVRSVNAFPCNWSAWTALQALCGQAEAEAPETLHLSPHWMLGFFHASLALEVRPRCCPVSCV